MDLAIKIFFFEWHLEEFHDVRKHCILYPTKSLIFCKSLLLEPPPLPPPVTFFQNKARIADNL